MGMYDFCMNKVHFGAIGAILTVLLVGFLVYVQAAPSKYDDFAQCINDSGAIFYGAFWCSHCQAQKALFGRAAGNLPYVECSTADSQRQTAICQQKKIRGYPTWVYPDGSVQSGEVSLEELAEKTSCLLPE